MLCERRTSFLCLQKTTTWTRSQTKKTQKDTNRPDGRNDCSQMDVVNPFLAHRGVRIIVAQLIAYQKKPLMCEISTRIVLVPP